ncbi:hypothetical protein SAMN04489735_103414 [Aneurinibacillus thermoaerophilus]|uniref:GDSL-like Lipase/Acylhydrolase family protein n=2 Tax=Aneurinibacillus thermoaerophilus TaxID=143495 RepID=A0A1G8DKH7_ANETH|nr:hypothetical protein [Aneurinibacillus sp. XH2]AMA71715.1 hypothetical protein ACH33_01900 [Aneurinibacillus sp. XH2]SDH58213.1 hypothetical protein SAMN04489735_103414 [Aneurinibacillus thermoaerophilus]
MILSIFSFKLNKKGSFLQLVRNEKGEVTLRRSKRRRKQSWWMRGFLWALLLVALCEAFIFRNPALYGMSPASFIGQITDVEKRLESQNTAKIKLLVLGDSQSMDALRPPLLAARYGLKPDEVFNLSISGGKAVDMLHLYEKHKQDLPNLQHVIISVNEHQLNASTDFSDNKFRYHATLAERLQVPHFENKMDLAFGWLLYSYGLREVWTEMAKLYWEDKLPQPPRDQYKYKWGLPPVEAREANHLGPAYAAEVAKRWMRDYQLKGVETNALERLMKELSKQGVSFTVVQLPRTQAFETIMKKQYASEQAAYRHLVGELSTRYNGRFIIIPPTLDDSYFRDANHVNKKGAEKITAELSL